MDNLELLHQRYAKALFVFAVKDSNADEIMRDIGALTDIIRSSKEISQALGHPEISKNEKIKILEALSDKDKFCNGFMNFLKVLTRKNRLHLMHGIFLRYRDYYDEKRKKTKVFIKTAVKLKKEQLDKLLKHLCGFLKEDVILDVELDASLIGGLFVKIHDKIYDTSIKRMLHEMNRKLMV